jgi:putative transposase
MEQTGPLNEAADDGKSGPRRLPNGGTSGLSDARWAEAQRRAAVIAPLAALESVSVSAACEAGRTLGLSERTIYGLLRLWQRSGGLVTSLAPRPSAGGRGKGRLTAMAEQLVTEAIRDEYEGIASVVR